MLNNIKLTSLITTKSARGVGGRDTGEKYDYSSTAGYMCYKNTNVINLMRVSTPFLYTPALIITSYPWNLEAEGRKQPAVLLRLLQLLPTLGSPEQKTLPYKISVKIE